MTRPPNSTFGTGRAARRTPRVIAALSKEREQQRTQQIRDELARLREAYYERRGMTPPERKAA